VKAVLQDTKWMLLLNDDIYETYRSRAISECSGKRLTKLLGAECTTADTPVTQGFPWIALSPIFEMVAGDQEVGLVIEDEEEDALMEIMTNKYSKLCLYVGLLNRVEVCVCVCVCVCERERERERSERM